MIQVKGFSGARYQGYESEQEAIDAWEHALAINAIGSVVPTQTPPPSNRHILGSSQATAGRRPLSHTPSRTQSTSLQAFTSRSPFNPLSFHYVVLRGLSPGVYHGR